MGDRVTRLDLVRAPGKLPRLVVPAGTDRSSGVLEGKRRQNSGNPRHHQADRDLSSYLDGTATVHPLRDVAAESQEAPLEHCRAGRAGVA
jgi:hypothetical protein